MIKDLKIDKKDLEILLTGACEKYVCSLDGKTYYYKLESAEDNNKATNTVFAEAFVSYLSKILEVKCVESELAHITITEENKKERKTVGCLIKSFLEEGDIDSKSLLSFTRHSGLGNTETDSFNSIYNSVKNTLQNINKLAVQYKDVRTFLFEKNLVSDLVNHYILDYVFCNCDRHGENIEFIQKDIDEKTHNFRVAKMFDNGKSLGLWLTESDLSMMQEESNWVKNYTENRAIVCFTLEDEYDGNNNDSIKLLQKYFEKKVTVNPDGTKNFSFLENDKSYILSKKLAAFDIRKHLKDFMLSYIPEENLEESYLDKNELDVEEILPAFNNVSGLNLTKNHIKAIVEPFNYRQDYLNNTLQNVLENPKAETQDGGQ